MRVPAADLDALMQALGPANPVAATPFGTCS
jgi:hypothetical protein